MGRCKMNRANCSLPAVARNYHNGGSDVSGSRHGAPLCTRGTPSGLGGAPEGALERERHILTGAAERIHEPRSKRAVREFSIFSAVSGNNIKKSMVVSLS